MPILNNSKSSRILKKLLHILVITLLLTSVSIPSYANAITYVPGSYGYSSYNEAIYNQNDTSTTATDSGSTPIQGNSANTIDTDSIATENADSSSANSSNSDNSNSTAPSTTVDTSKSDNNIPVADKAAETSNNIPQIIGWVVVILASLSIIIIMLFRSKKQNK